MCTTSFPRTLIKSGTQLYIPDESYGYLPATVQNDVLDNSGIVSVVVALPSDWKSTTLIPEKERKSPPSQSQERKVPLSSFLINKKTPSLEHHSHDSSDSYSSQQGRQQEYYFPLMAAKLSNNEDGFDCDGQGDLTKIKFIHEASMLYAIKSRLAKMKPYARVGDIIISVNPFQWIQNLYSEDVQNYYINKFVWKVPEQDQKRLQSQPISWGEPHVYEVSSKAFANISKPLDPSKSTTNRQNPNQITQNCENHRYRQDQTIFVTGSSASGKTVTCKIILTHLSIMELTRPIQNASSRSSLENYDVSGVSFFNKSMTVTKIIESNPIFEAFGNAKTYGNNNSSRFGRVTKVQFDIREDTTNLDVPFTRMVGCVNCTYLLEKNRAIRHSAGERGFHIFYQLLAAPPTFLMQVWKEGFKINESFEEGGGRRMTCPSDFRYLIWDSRYGTSDGQDDVDAVPGMSDSKNWISTRKALQVFGIIDEELITLVRALCVVLQLGNITFGSNVTQSAMPQSGEYTVVTSDVELNKLSSLMGVSTPMLEDAFTTKMHVKRGVAKKLKLTPVAARKTCDTFAKELYGLIWNYLLEKINFATDAIQAYSSERWSQLGHISIVDMFGLENFPVNGFEQFCANYTSETIQHRYVTDNFKIVTDEYIAENLRLDGLDDLHMVDNSDLMHLLSGKIGIVVALNEECMRQGGSDSMFVYKVKTVHEMSTRMSNNRCHSADVFSIRHSADTIQYNADEFMEKNINHLTQELINLGCKCSNSIIKQQFSKLGKSSMTVLGESKQTKDTVLSKFRSELNSFMAVVDQTKTHYICCIRPNRELKPLSVNQNETLMQLRATGAVAATKLNKERYPQNMSTCDFLKRYGFLYFDDVKNIGTMDPNSLKEGAEYILNELLPRENINGEEVSPWRIGRTKIFFRTGVLNRIEIIIDEFIQESATRLQSWVRMRKVRREFVTDRNYVVLAQALFRARVERRRYWNVLSVIQRIQSNFRRRIAINEARKLFQHRAATKIASQWRSYSCSQVFLRQVKAAKQIQKACRFEKNKNNLLTHMFEVVEAARRDRRRANVRNQIHRATISNLIDEPEVIGEIESVYNNLMEEVVQLRNDKLSLTSHLQETNRSISSQERRIFTLQADILVAHNNVNRLASMEQERAAKDAERRAGVHLIKQKYKETLLRLEEEKFQLMQSYQKEIRSQRAEIAMLRASLESEQKVRAINEVKMRSSFKEKQELYKTEILALNKQLKDTQNNHEGYLKMLMKVLERTHNAREEEFTKHRQELAAINEAKDAEIHELRSEVFDLRSKIVCSQEARQYTASAPGKTDNSNTLNAAGIGIDSASNLSLTELQLPRTFGPISLKLSTEDENDMDERLRCELDDP